MISHIFVYIYLITNEAYYLDYQEKRPSYVNAFFDKLVNWDFAEGNFVAVASTNDAKEL